MKRFNTAGTCYPKVHYMVNIDRQVNAAAKLVRRGNYFCINRGRQYGKTTTLAALNQVLESEFCVFSISFEGTGDSAFASVENACAEFLKILKQWSRVNGSTDEMKSLLKEVVPFGCKEIDTTDFIGVIDELCHLSEKPIVVLIDEVDQASNNEGFIKFLGVLRKMYLAKNEFQTFQSVILACVYDIKNLKLKIRSDEEHQYNSPWNIAVPFNESMSLPAEGIAGMLAEYKADHQLSFDVNAIGQLIYDYTSGYPFLVSRICQIIDNDGLPWDKEGTLKAVNVLLKESNTLFDDMHKKITQYHGLSELLQSIIFDGKRIAYNYYDRDINIAALFNFVIEDQGTTKVSCRIFETWLYNYFISNDKTSSIYQQGEYEKNQFIHDGYIDMKHLLERFCVHFNDIFRTVDGSMDQKFIEAQGRKQFLLYLRPIINGIGNYYIEAETRDLTRTDVVVDYLGRQYVIELKIWHGNAYKERGEKQLSDYLDLFHLQTGYMVSFCFNRNKQPGVKEIMVGGRKLVEAIV